MAEWIQFDPTALFPSEIEQVTDALSAFINALAPVLDAIGSAIDIATAFMLAFDDVLKPLYDTLVAALNLVIQSLTQTGVYKLTYFTPSFSHYITPQEWLQAVSESLYDKSDERRPILIDPDGFVGAIIVMATADNLKDLRERFDGFFNLLKVLVVSLTQVSEWPTYPEEFQVAAGHGREPNWNSIKIADIVPGLNQFCAMLMGLVNSLLPAKASSDILNELADQLLAKITKLQNFLNKIMAVIAAIQAILTFEGVFLLPVSGTGDADWLSNEWTSTTGGPLDVPNATYTVGGVFLAVGGTDASTLFSFFGL